MRILVVEDEPAAAAVLAKGLREHAYAVDVAADGSTALEQAGISDYDLIVLDVLMPGLNGLEVCRRLRAALGAKRDGVIRHFGVRRDGSARDVVMYSILASEWSDVRRHLELRLSRHAAAAV
jgi:CheY-like chemotaxis protein